MTHTDPSFDASGNPTRFKHDRAATVDPTSTDDDSKGYAAGSTWWNTTAGRVWGCLDATTSAAVWRRLSGPPVPISPAQITADQNDYAAVGSADVARLSTDASRTVTGFVAVAGHVLVVVNVGSTDLVLANDSASSAAANRMLLGGSNVTLSADASVTLWYDDTSSRWRKID